MFSPSRQTGSARGWMRGRAWALLGTVMLVASILAPPASAQAIPAPNQVEAASADAARVGEPAAAVSLDAVAPALRRYPYLTDVVKNYATINFGTDRSATTASVKWGKAGSTGCTPTTTVSASKIAVTVNSTLQYQWKAKLTLQAGGQYCYRVFLGSTDLLGTDPTPTFRTQLASGSTVSYSFAVFGDWGEVDSAGNNVHQANLMSRIASSGVRFAVTTGDNAYPNGSWNNYGDLVTKGAGVSSVFGPSFWTVAGASIPIFPIIGNHDMNSTSVNHPTLILFPQDRAVADSNGRYARETYCCLNGTTSASYPSAWYAFTAGTTRFYLLEAAWGSTNLGTGSAYENDADYRWTPSSPEYQWLEADLQAHPTGLKIALFHYPVYSDNSTEPSDTFLHGSNSLEGLLGRYGVDLAFSGHAHTYQRYVPNAQGVVSYVTGGGGARLEPVGQLGCSSTDAYAIGWSYSANGGAGGGSKCGAASVPTSIDRVFHFLKVTVKGGQVTVTPTDSMGRTFDVRTYTFDTGPGPGATPTPSASPIFSDGFESGSLGAWTTKTGLVVQTALVHQGTFGARGTTTVGATYAKKALPATYGEGYLRTWFDLASFSSQVNLLRLRTAADASLGYVFVTTGGKLAFRNDVAATTVTTATTVATGSWHSLELRMAVAGTTSTAEVWYDGAKVIGIPTTNLGTTPIGKIQIGEVTAGRTYDVAFDKVAFATQRLGP
jgi:hypothetical protein